MVGEGKGRREGGKERREGERDVMEEGGRGSMRHKCTT